MGWKESNDASEDQKKRRMANEDSIVHMQYNILALGLTETGGFGNTFPASEESAFDATKGYGRVLAQFTKETKLDKGRFKKWAKASSPSLMWLNQKAEKHRQDVMKRNKEWAKVNKDILFNWSLNMNKLQCEILETQADILTFQEVDTFRAGGKYNLEDRMAELGYKGVHQPKQGDG